MLPYNSDETALEGTDHNPANTPASGQSDSGAESMLNLAVHVANLEVAVAAALADYLLRTNIVAERIEVAEIIEDKLFIARRLYEALQSSHSCEPQKTIRLEYPIRTWSDVGAATFFVSTLVAKELEQQKNSGQVAWSLIAREHLPLERRCVEASLNIVFSSTNNHGRESVLKALRCWYSYIKARYRSFASDVSEVQSWQKAASEQLSSVGFLL